MRILCISVRRGILKSPIIQKKARGSNPEMKEWMKWKEILTTENTESRTELSDLCFLCSPCSQNPLKRNPRDRDLATDLILHFVERFLAVDNPAEAACQRWVKRI